MRRRTNAYTFDRDLYQQWRMGGSVWIDEGGTGNDKPDRDDPGTDQPGNEMPDTNDRKPPAGHEPVNISATMLQLFRSSSATAEEIKNATNRLDCKNNDNNTHLGTNEQVLFRKSELTNIHQLTETSTQTCVGVPAIAEEQKPKHAEQPQNIEIRSLRAPDCSSARVAEIPQTKGFAEEEPGFPTETMIADRLKIHAADYKPLECPEPLVPCYSCGKKGSWYVEKLTAERKARPKDEKDARRMCRKCYAAAVRRDRAAAPPLPGVINLGNLEQCSGTLGRCSVCNLSAATFLNRITGVKLCEQCHTRELRQQCCQTGVSV